MPNSDASSPEADAREAQRLEALWKLNILDTPAEPQFDRIVRIAAEIFGTPISTITFIDAARQWFKAKVGVAGSENPRNISFCAHAIQSNDVTVIEDAATDSRFRDNPLVKADPHIRFYAGAPLCSTEGHNIGTLCIIDRVPRTLDGHKQQLLADLASIVVDELELRALTRDLNHIAATDMMTGAFNRRYFLAAADKEFARFRRHATPVAVMMLDIDHFKQINDRFGHETGDRTLVEVARLLLATLRKEDVMGRIGGEEFAIILPGTEREEAVAVAERIRAAHEAIRFDANGPVSVTASLGLTMLLPGDENFNTALRRADEALYRAKAAGRNCVIAT